MAQLVFIDGRRMGTVIALHPANSLGRARENSIVLTETGVLDRHAVLTFADGAYRISKADPAAPVTVNGRPATEQILRHGDILSIGEVALLFSEDSPSPSHDFLRQPIPDPGPSTVESRVKHFADAEATMAALRRGRRAIEQIETLYLVGSAVSSTLKLSDLVELLLTHLFSVFRPDRCFVLLRDDQGNLRVQGERTSERSRLAGSVKVSRTILNEAIERREAIRTRRAVEDERFAGGQSVADQGIQSAMCAPMVKGDRILGVIHVDRVSSQDAYEEEDLNLLNAVGTQAAIAIENVQIHERELAYSRSLVRLEESSRRVSSSLSQDFILREAVEHACRIFECSKASLLLLDPSGAHLTVAWSNCIDRKIWPSVKIRPGEGYAGRVFQGGRALLVREVPEPAARPYETASFVIAPVLSLGEGLQAESRPIGVLSVTDKVSRGPFTPDDQELLAIFAAQVGTALNNARLFERATVDPLTHLYTRQYFNFRFEEEVRGHLERSAPLTLLMADLDHFKDKNDVYGHPVGDVILSEAAAILKERVPAGGFAARYGGEEFVAILSGLPADRARDLAQDIRLALEGHEFNAQSEPIHCTISIGVAEIQPGETAEKLLKRADTALYTAKRAGRNRVEVSRGGL